MFPRFLPFYTVIATVKICLAKLIFLAGVFTLCHICYITRIIIIIIIILYESSIVNNELKAYASPQCDVIIVAI